MVQIIWSHGWGFNAAFFKPLCQKLACYQHFVIDWGYFGEPHLPLIDLNKPIIGIGHSLGLAKLLSLKLPLHSLISLGGVTHFAQSKTFPAGTPKRILARMQAKFCLQPQQVLADFYTSCGYSAPPFDLINLESMKTELLQQDLNQLMTLSAPLPEIPILAIAADADQVCSLSQQQAQFNNLKIIQAQHYFPHNDPVQTAALIQQFLQPFLFHY